MKIYIPEYYETSGGAGRFFNTLKKYLSDYEIIHNFEEKNIDIALINAGIWPVKPFIDFKFNNPNVPIIHRLDGLSSREKREKGDYTLKDLNSFTDYTIFQSKHCKEIFKDIITPKNYNIIINGSEFQPLLTKSTDNKIKIYHSSWAVGKWKQQDKVFDFIKAVETREDIEFYLFGNYLSLNELIEHKIDCSKDPKNIRFFEENNKLFESFKNVKYLGYLTKEEQPSLISSMDFLFFPSIMDSCPNTVVEAICCGIPVIYHNSGGTPEIVGPAGIDISQYNYDYIKLLDYIKIEKANYKNLAKTRQNLFSIKSTAKKYKKIFKIFEGVVPKKIELRIGWIMCFNSTGGSSRIGGFNLHDEFKKLGIYSSILHENENFSVGIEGSLEAIKYKIKQENINTLILQKVHMGNTLELCAWCKANNIKIVFAVGDIAKTPLFDIANLVIVSSVYFKDYILKMYPQANVEYIDDGIETSEKYKIHQDKENLTIGWYGNKDRFNETLFIKSILKKGDTLFSIANCSEASFSMGYGCKIPWNVSLLESLLINNTDAIALPVDLTQQKNLFKSANRLTLAYSLGLPVIASRVPSYEVACGYFCQSALFADVNNIKEWSNHLDFLRTAINRVKLAHVGYHTITDRYNKNTIAKEYIIRLRQIFN